MPPGLSSRHLIGVEVPVLIVPVGMGMEIVLTAAGVILDRVLGVILIDDQFLPLSMWVAIRCAEDGAWFGHNLSSANLVARFYSVKAIELRSASATSKEDSKRLRLDINAMF